MDTAYAVDMSLPAAEDGLGGTPIMFVGIHDSMYGSERPNAVEYHGDIDAHALDSTVDFSASSTSEQLFDGGLTELGDCHMHPIASQWPMLSPQSLLGPTPGTASLMDTNSAHDRAPGERPGSSRPRANSGQSNLHKVDRTRKTKGSQRLHYEVEKRYRSTLNEKYATLAQTLSSDEMQRICGAESPDWAVQMDGILASSKDKQGGTGGAARQGKTATLSATIETINLLTKCCNREARDLEQLRQSVGEIRNRVQEILHPEPPMDSQHDDMEP